MLLHVLLGETALLFVIRLLLRVGHGLPPRAQDLGYVGVVHVGTGLQYLPALVFRPDHERVHWAFDVRLACFIALRLTYQLGFLGLVGRRLAPSRWNGREEVRQCLVLMVVGSQGISVWYIVEF